MWSSYLFAFFFYLLSLYVFLLLNLSCSYFSSSPYFFFFSLKLWNSFVCYRWDFSFWRHTMLILSCGDVRSQSCWIKLRLSFFFANFFLFTQLRFTHSPRFYISKCISTLGTYLLSFIRSMKNDEVTQSKVIAFLYYLLCSYQVPHIISIRFFPFSLFLPLKFYRKLNFHFIFIRNLIAKCQLFHFF